MSVFCYRPSQIEKFEQMKNKPLQDLLNIMQQPNEIQLKVDPNSAQNTQLKVLNRQRQPQPIKRLQKSQNIAANLEFGLLSLSNFQTDKLKIRLMICITAYNESREQLEASLKGILGELEVFNKNGISPQEILVVVMFDGIEKLNSDPDNDKNMLQFFKHYDYQCNIENNNNQQMQTQYKLYQENLELSKKDIEKEKKKLEQAKILRQDQIVTEIEKQKEEKRNAQKYIDDRSNNAYVYQIREKLKYQNIKEEDSEELLTPNQQKNTQSELELSSFDRSAHLQQQLMTDNKHLPPQKNQKEVVEEKSVLKQKSELEEELESLALNIFYCVKFKNGGKLSSHLWFFRGFCEQFQPDYCILLDCAIEPKKNSIWNIFLSMECDENIGGACGYMDLKLENASNDQGQRNDEYDKDKVDFISHTAQKIFNIQRAQKFEYDFSHIIDKAFESSLGFINVLPGAFSAYRWEALMQVEDTKEESKLQQQQQDQQINNSENNNNVTTKSSILDYYLKTCLDPNVKFLTLEEQNKFLAEDRLLCQKLYCHQKKKYFLMYMPDAEVIVDSITNMIALMGQRRRWINGSWYAFEDVQENSDDVSLSKHNDSTWEVFKFKVCIFFGICGKYFSYYVLSIYFTFFFMVLRDFFELMPVGVNQSFGYLAFSLMSSISIALTIILLLFLIFLSYNYKNNDKNVIGKFYAISTFLSILMIIIFVLMVWGIINILASNENKNNMSYNTSITNTLVLQVFIGMSLASFILPVFWEWRKIPDILCNVIHYIYYTPMYITILIIYAFCRIDDFAWGTKGSNSQHGNKNDNIQQESKQKKFNFVLKWMCSNTAVMYLFMAFTQDKTAKAVIVIIFAILVTVYLAIKSLLSLIYYVWYYCFFKRKREDRLNKNREIYKARAKEIKTHMLDLFQKYVQNNDYQNNQPQNQNINNDNKHIINNDNQNIINNDNINNIINNNYQSVINNEQQNFSKSLQKNHSRIF